MRTILIKILFKLLKVENYTKNLIYIEDLKRIKPIEAKETIEALKFKYNKALSTVLSIPHFIEWLYLQVIEKQREHLLTLDKQKQEAQRSSILFILYLINEIQEADKKMKLYNKK
jgi:hypothetical protein